MKNLSMFLITLLPQVIFGQQMYNFFESNMIRTDKYDTTWFDMTTFKITYYDTIGAEISVFTYNNEHELSDYTIGETYFDDYINYPLKKIGWSNDNKLAYYCIYDADGSELYWVMSDTGVQSVIKLYPDRNVIELDYYSTGELMSRSVGDKDSVLNKEFYINGNPKRVWYSLFLSEVPIGVYYEYDTLGNLIVEGHYYSAFEHNKHAQEMEAQNKFVKSGVKHGQWIYYNSKGRVIRFEVYQDGALIFSSKKRQKRV